MTRKQLIEKAQITPGLQVRKLSERYDYPCIIVRHGRGAAAVCLYEDGSILRHDVRNDLAKKLSPARAARVLGVV